VVPRGRFRGEPDKQFGNWLPVNGFVCPEFEPRLLRDDGDTVIRVNKWGTTERVPADGRHMPYPVGFPVKDAATWARLKERLRPDSGPRLPPDWERLKRECDAADVPAFIGGLPCGFFGAPRELFGVENWLLCFYDSPALAHEVLDTLCDLWCALFSRVASELRVDMLFIWEDMCYRNGPLLSPALFREFMLPRYQTSHPGRPCGGVPLVLADTDGNCDALLPLFIEGGVDLVIPFEVQSRMDVHAVRRRYPTLGLAGGIGRRCRRNRPRSGMPNWRDSATCCGPAAACRAATTVCRRPSRSVTMWRSTSAWARW